MGAVDPQATTARERLARRRRRRKLTRIALLVALALAVGVFLLYRSYFQSVGVGAPEAGVSVLVAVVERKPEAAGAETGHPGTNLTEAGRREVGEPEAGEPGAGDLEAGGSEAPEGAEAAGRRELQAAAVLALDPARQRATVISLPADTWLGADGDPDEGESLADRYGQGGVAGLKAAAEDLLDVVIHHRVEVDMGAVAALVDRLSGGVPVTVRTPIVYRGPDGEEIFRLDPGNHMLDGQAALLFLRYRGDDWLGEVPRAQRQRDFVVALARAFLEQGSLGNVREVYAQVQDRVTTDLGPLQLVRLAELVRRIDPDDVGFVLLPGNAEGGRWVPDAVRVREMVARVFPQPPEG